MMHDPNPHNLRGHWPNHRDCKHGQLARSCERCEDERLIAELLSMPHLDDIGLRIVL